MDFATRSPRGGDELMLASAGRLSPVSFGSLSPVTPESKFGRESSPVSVLECFSVLHSEGNTQDGLGQQVAAAVDGPAEVVAQDLDQFRKSCTKPVVAILDRPARRSRAKRIYSGPVRHSARNRGKFAAGTPVKRQQRELITRLQIAREGETIRDEALNAYLDLFRQPLPQRHIDVILGLFGWLPDVLPTSEDLPVECLT